MTKKKLSREEVAAKWIFGDGGRVSRDVIVVLTSPHSATLAQIKKMLRELDAAQPRRKR